MRCAPFGGGTFRLFPRFPLIRDGRTQVVRLRESWTSHAETSHSSRVNPFLSGVRVLPGALQTRTQKDRQRRSFPPLRFRWRGGTTLQEYSRSRSFLRSYDAQQLAGAHCSNAETLGAAKVSHVEGHDRRSRPNGYFQNTIIIGVGQHGPPPEIALHEPRSAAQVLDEIVDIRSAQARFSDSPLQDALVLKCQCGRNHRSPLPPSERLQQMVGSTQAGE